MLAEKASPEVNLSDRKGHQTQIKVQDKSASTGVHFLSN